jgi:hypothetical protein
MKAISSYTKAWLKEVWGPFNLKNNYFKMGRSKIWNMDDKYGIIKTQLPKKEDGA